MIMATCHILNKACSEIKEKKVVTPKPNFLLYLFPPSFSGIRRSWACKTGRDPHILLSALSTQTHLHVYAQRPTETFQSARHRKDCETSCLVQNIVSSLQHERSLRTKQTLFCCRFQCHKFSDSASVFLLDQVCLTKTRDLQLIYVTGLQLQPLPVLTDDPRICIITNSTGKVCFVRKYLYTKKVRRHMAALVLLTVWRSHDAQ